MIAKTSMKMIFYNHSIGQFPYGAFNVAFRNPNSLFIKRLKYPVINMQSIENWSQQSENAENRPSCINKFLQCKFCATF